MLGWVEIAKGSGGLRQGWGRDGVGMGRGDGAAPGWGCRHSAVLWRPLLSAPRTARSGAGEGEQRAVPAVPRVGSGWGALPGVPLLPPGEPISSPAGWCGSIAAG